MDSRGPLFDGQPSETQNHDAYKAHLFSFIPLYSLKLEQVGEFPFAERLQVRSPEDVAAMFFDYYRNKAQEEFLIVLLDTANVVIGIVQISVGGIAASIVEPRAVFGAAISANAAAIIAVHNHPSLNIEPSREDIRITRQLVEAGKIMGISLKDHVIIGGKGFTSLAERGLLT